MSSAHWCFAYSDDSGLQAVAAQFLSEGVQLGQQVGFFGWGGEHDLRRGLSGLAAAEELRQRGALRLTSLEQHFRRDQPPGPRQLAQFWSAATEAALDGGFRGLRVVADTTPWADFDADQRTVFLREEQLVDRYRLQRPFTLVCVFDASILSGDAVVETACIHPFAEGASPPFHLHAAEDADFALHGEIDGLAAGLLDRVLESLPGGDPARGLVIEASGLSFIDHRSLLCLERHAERVGLQALVLRNGPPGGERIAELVDLQRVRVEASQ